MRAGSVNEKKKSSLRKADYAEIASDTDTPVAEVIRIAKENGLAY